MFPFLLGITGIGVIGTIDWVTGREVSFSVFYLLPITFVTWKLGVRAGLFVALLSATTWLGVEYLLEKDYSQPWIPVWNASVRLGFFVVVSLQLGRIRYLTGNLERLVHARTAELAAEIRRREQVELEVSEVSRCEQTRLSHELHDHLGAHLAGVAFRSKAVAENLQRRGLPEADDAQQVTALVNASLGQLRGFARWLSPVEASEGGLSAGLSRLGAEFETLFEITCVVETAQALPPISPETGRQLYRIAQETLRNAVQHGRAQCAEIRLGVAGDLIELRVTCDGETWHPPNPTASPEGLGLRIMDYRARMLGGHLSIRPRNDGGTIMECRVPSDPVRVSIPSYKNEPNSGSGGR